MSSAFAAKHPNSKPYSLGPGDAVKTNKQKKPTYQKTQPPPKKPRLRESNL